MELSLLCDVKVALLIFEYGKTTQYISDKVESMLAEASHYIEAYTTNDYKRLYDAGSLQSINRKKCAFLSTNRDSIQNKESLEILYAISNIACSVSQSVEDITLKCLPSPALSPQPINECSSDGSFKKLDCTSCDTENKIKLYESH